MRLAEDIAPALAAHRGHASVALALVAVAAVVLAAIVAFWPTVASLLGYWNNYDNLSYTHGPLIAAICVWLAWRARFDLAAAFGRFSIAGFACLVALTVAWGFARLASLEVVHQALFPLLLLAAIASLAGWRAARAMLLPVGFLYFAIPVWDFINFLLQDLTIVAVTLFLKLVAVPAWFDGPYVHLGSGSFEIAGGCSGLHFFIVANALAVLYGELGRDTLGTRVKLVLIAAGMALAMNWIRVATIIVAGYLTDMQSFLVKVDHYYFGWALFGVLLVIYFRGVPRWLKLQDREPPAAVVAGAGAAPPVGRTLVALLLTLAGLAVVPAFVAQAWQQAVSQPNAVSSAAIEVPGWAGPQPPDQRWQPQYAGADAMTRAAYAAAAGRVEVFAAYFAWQGQGRELGGGGNGLFAEGELQAQGAWTPADGTQPARPWLSAVDRDGGRWLVWQAFEVGGQRHGSEFRAKLMYPFALAWGRPGSHVLAVAARCESDCEAAAQALEEFLSVAEAPLAAFGAGADTPESNQDAGK
jgi:EpsI family protein